MNPAEDITRLLSDLSEGKEGAGEALYPLIYDELRALAGYMMRDERRGHTLQTTALVHEAYIRLLGEEHRNWEDRAHYLRIATRAMRRVLIDHARRRGSEKRGGGRAREPLDEAARLFERSSLDLIALDDALKKLAELDPQVVQVVDLRFFGGITVEETARVLGISPRTVKRDWRMARAWLKNEISGKDQ